MKRPSVPLRAVFAAGLFAAGPAGAVMMADDQAAAAPRQTPRAAPAALAPTMDLIAGTVSSVDPAKRTMTVSGTAVTWHPAQLRVFAPNGARAVEGDVQPGMRVRFALEPGTGTGTATGAARRAVLIYLDGRS